MSYSHTEWTVVWGFDPGDGRPIRYTQRGHLTENEARQIYDGVAQRSHLLLPPARFVRRTLSKKHITVTFETVEEHEFDPVPDHH